MQLKEIIPWHWNICVCLSSIVKRIKDFFGLPVRINNWQTNSKILVPGTLAYFMRDKLSIFQRTENLPATLLSSSLLLSELYEGVDNTESLYYHKLALAAQDSLFSQEKNQQVEALRFSETLRQQEVEAARKQAEFERKNNLQYAGIAFGLIVFVIVFLLLSHSIIARPGLIRFLGVLALLIVFEFINLLSGTAR